MAETRRLSVFGNRPPCAYSSRIEKYRAKAKLERFRKPEKPNEKVCYKKSDNEEETSKQLCQKELFTSYSFVDYVRSRESGLKEYRHFKPEYSARHILTQDIIKEHKISLVNMNKVFCSQWLSDRQVIFGTKCHKLMVFDVITQQFDQIPALATKTTAATDIHQELQCGIRSLQINPSRTLLATAAKHPNDIAFYRLPTLDPVCVGEGAHKDWMFDLCWLDDQFLVSGSRDAKMALWKVEDPHCNESEYMPNYSSVKPLTSRLCRAAHKVRALVFNKGVKEIAALSLNGYIHIWKAETFKQKESRKLPSYQDNVCIAVRDDGSVYSVGCWTTTLLLDYRSLDAVSKISFHQGIRSVHFQENLLSVGTGEGMIMFYDLRAGKCLESSINSSAVQLKCSRGNMFPDEDYIDVFRPDNYSPAIFTHCYDYSGTRLFAAGGPLASNLYGNYAGLWQ